MINEKCEKIIWDLMNQLRGVLYSRNLAFSALRLVFLKYALDNYIGANTKEDMQQCVRAQKMFALRDVDNGIETIIPVLQYIDHSFGMQQILSGAMNVDEYARELFGADRLRQKKNATDDGFKSVIAYLGSLDLEEKAGESVGRDYADTFIDVIGAVSDRNSFSGEFVSNLSVCDLAGRLLHVTSEDRFVDFMSGTGVSTLKITGDAHPHIACAERQDANAAISAMLYILHGYKDIRVYAADSISDIIPDLQGNKLFVDPPLAGKIEKSTTNEYTDLNLAALNRVMHNYLTLDGEAVVLVPSSTLFQGKKQAAGLREELVQLGMVKAVIALPPMWYATTVNTNLLLISKKNMPQSDVLFIDATQDIKSTKNRSGMVTTISDEIIDKICATVEKREVISGFSCIVWQSDIRENGFNLVPSTYIPVQPVDDPITMEEVDAQLAELYRQLAE